MVILLLRFEKPIGKLDKKISDIKLVQGADVEILERILEKKHDKKKVIDIRN